MYVSHVTWLGAGFGKVVGIGWNLKDNTANWVQIKPVMYSACYVETALNICSIDRAAVRMEISILDIARISFYLQPSSLMDHWGDGTGTRDCLML